MATKTYEDFFREQFSNPANDGWTWGGGICCGLAAKGVTMGIILGLGLGLSSTFAFPVLAGAMLLGLALFWIIKPAIDLAIYKYNEPVIEDTQFKMT